MNKFLSIFKKSKKVEGRTSETNTIINDLEEGVVIYTPEFEIALINPAAEEIFKVKSQEISGKKITPELLKDKKFRTLTQVIFPSLAPSITQKSNDGWPQVVEIRTDNPEMNLITTLNKITTESGETKSFVKIIQNKTRERELLDAKTEFITTSAHQLRTPLNTVSWAFESIENSTEDENIKDIASQGLEISKRGLKIINDLLNAIQIEEGKFGQKAQNININELIEKIVEEAKLIASKYEISMNVDSDGSYQAMVDPERISTAITVLIDNAIRYNNEKGSINVGIKKANDSYVQISISDTGIGMSQEDIDKVFEKFYRGDSAAQAEPNGSGLGLYIAKNIVEKHGGEISVKSTPGRGSTFTLTLPLA
ncbi:MAG: PAS domain-containing sensor histidine kinase [Candidatus Paceibacterota bacterium]